MLGKALGAATVGGSLLGVIAWLPRLLQTDSRCHVANRMARFLVCDKKSPCSPDGAATVTFRLEKVPDRCCSLLVMNGNGTGKAEVETFRVTVNGRPIAFTADVATRFLAAVDLKQENTIAVEIHGAPDAYVQVWLFAPPSTNDSAPDAHL